MASIQRIVSDIMNCNMKCSSYPKTGSDRDHVHVQDPIDSLQGIAIR
jgi:hypothetical protein